MEDLSLKFSSFSYPFASLEEQEAIAVFTTYTVMLDDLANECIPDLESFTRDLVLGQASQYEILRGFRDFLSTQQRIFGKFGGDMVVKASIEYISTSVLEQILIGQLDIPPAASKWMNYFRAKTGIGEAFAMFCLPESTVPETQILGRYITAIPSLANAIAQINDVLSFYKEQIRGQDDSSIVMAYARVHHLTHAEALDCLKNETLEAVMKVRSILADEPVSLSHVNQFINGYIYWHLQLERYKMSDLDLKLDN